MSTTPFPVVALGTSRPAVRLRRRTESQGIRKTLLAATFAFMLLYNISFKAAPSVTTGRVALVILALLLWRELFRVAPRFVRERPIVSVVLVLLLLHAAFLYWANGGIDSNQLSRQFHFLFYVVLGALVVAAAMKGDRSLFASAVAVAGFAQALFVAFAYVSPGFRARVADLLVQSGNIPLDSGVQVAGFSNSSGALLSVTQSLGVFCALLAARLAKRRRSVWVHSTMALGILLSTLVVGRTGFILSLVFWAIFTVVDRGLSRRALVVISVLCALGGVAMQGRVLARLRESNPNTDRTVEWLLDLGKGTRSGAVEDLMSQRRPEWSVGSAMLGTGLVAGEAGEGNATGNDSGYVQTFFALGLIGGGLFYGAVAALFVGLARRTKDGVLLGVLTVAMFVIELKEPFLFKYSVPFVALSLGLLATAGVGRQAIIPGPAVRRQGLR